MTAHEHLPSAAAERAKLTVADFATLSDAGAFDRYARSELIEGEIWVVNAIHRRHARAHAVLTVELGIARKACEPMLDIFSNPSTELSDISLPEPDVVLAEPADDKWIAGPTVRLAVEVSDSTLDFDLGRKATLYAKHGVPEYWVVDVEARVIRQFWAVAGEAYGERREVAFGTAITAATIDGLVVDTFDL